MKTRLFLLQLLFFILFFCLNSYLFRKVNAILLVLSLIVLSLLICRYMLISQKMFQTAIFSAVSCSIIGSSMGFVGYQLGLNPRFNDMTFIVAFALILILFLLHSGFLYLICRIIKKKWTKPIFTESASLKKIENVLMLFIIPLICFILYCTYVNSSPERVLKKQFSISLDNFDYTIIHNTTPEVPIPFNYKCIYFRFRYITQENIEYLQSLPMQQLPLQNREKMLQMIFKGAHSQKIEEFYPSDDDYYMFDNHSSCCGLYNKIFIVDTEKKVAILYYQIMG